MRILLVDDHTMMRDGLKAVLEKEPEFRIVGEAATGHEAIDMAHRLKPRIVIMDISMPELNGVDATRRLVAELAGIKVIALSTHSDRRYVTSMFGAGAVGYLLKSSAAAELVQAVRVVARHQAYVSPAIAGIIVDGLTARDVPRPEMPLSSREREVLQLLAEGSSSKEIAGRLKIAVPTVETHRRQIMDKLNLRTIAELTKYAIREGLTSIEG